MLKLNVGLSRKVGEANYGSRGASVDVEMEVESTLVSDQNALKERIRQLFGLVRTSLAEELNGANGHAQQPSQSQQSASPPSQNGNGSGQQNGNPRPATKSQVKAIQSICHNKRIDLAAFLNNRFHVGRPEDLNIKTASTAIDELKTVGG